MYNNYHSNSHAIEHKINNNINIHNNQNLIFPNITDIRNLIAQSTVAGHATLCPKSYKCDGYQLITNLVTKKIY